MKVLLLDIETAPNLAYVWGLWQQNIAINQIENSGYTLCWAAKWLGEEKIHFDSVYKSGSTKMVGRIHKMLSEADAVITYNGIKFDLPTLNKEFLLHGMTPPAPYKNIDLLQTCRKQFRFPSNKLDYVCQALGLGEKVRHTGHELWVQCMNNDKAAWKVMQEYNQQDVVLLEELYKELLAWIPNHPNLSTRSGNECCTNCGSDNYQSRGVAVTSTQKYNRFQCQDCGTWFRGSKTITKNKTDKFVQVQI